MSGGLLVLASDSCDLNLIQKSSSWIITKATFDILDSIIFTVYFKPDLDFKATLITLQQALDEIYSFDTFGCTTLTGTRNSMDTTCNGRGYQLIKFVAANNFILLNVRSQIDQHGRSTFNSKLDTSTFDFIWVSLVGGELVKNMWVVPLITISDHLSVTVELILLFITPGAALHSPAPIHYSLRWNRKHMETYRDLMLWSPLVATYEDNATPDQLCSQLCLAMNNANTTSNMTHKPFRGAVS